MIGQLQRLELVETLPGEAGHREIELRSACGPRRNCRKFRYSRQIATWCYMCYINPMYRRITQRELRNQSAAVLREVESGRTIVVTRNGTPVAELRPIRPHRFVPRATLAEAAARAPRIDRGRFRRDLDAVIDQRIDG
jgi:prevent-host-death family protein